MPQPESSHMNCGQIVILTMIVKRVGAPSGRGTLARYVRGAFILMLEPVVWFVRPFQIPTEMLNRFYGSSGKYTGRGVR